jgi:hypothetical protein
MRSTLQHQLKLYWLYLISNANTSHGKCVKFVVSPQEVLTAKFSIVFTFYVLVILSYRTAATAIQRPSACSNWSRPNPFRGGLDLSVSESRYLTSDIRILKSHIYDVGIQSYPIRHDSHYPYSNLNPDRNMKTNVISVISVRIRSVFIPNCEVIVLVLLQSDLEHASYKTKYFNFNRGFFKIIL